MPDTSNRPQNDPKTDLHTQKKSTGQWLWLSIAMLIAGIFLGRWLFAPKEPIVKSPLALSKTPAAASETPSISPQKTPADDNTPAQIQTVMTVEMVKPKMQNFAQTLTANGVIEAKEIAKVSASVAGLMIKKITVEVGDFVKKGQILAEFEDDSLQQNIVQAEADLAEAQARFAKAKADLTRVIPLVAIDAISKQEVDAYRTAKIQAQASVKSAQARLAKQKITLKDAKVVAPVTGRISERLAQVGSVVNGQDLFHIVVNSQLQW